MMDQAILKLALSLATLALPAPAMAQEKRPAAPAATTQHAVVPLGDASVVTVEPTTLFNSWKLSPAGRHVKVSDVPMKLLLAPDHAALLAVCGGNNPGLAVVDLKN